MTIWLFYAEGGSDWYAGTLAFPEGYDGDTGNGYVYWHGDTEYEPNQIQMTWNAFAAEWNGRLWYGGVFMDTSVGEGTPPEPQHWTSTNIFEYEFGESNDWAGLGNVYGDPVVQYHQWYIE